MKNFISIAVALLGFSLLSSNGAITETTGNLGAASRYNLQAGQLDTTTFILVNTNTLKDSFVWVFDSSSTNATFVIPAYTNISQLAQNYTNYYTNYYGAVNSNSFVGLVYVSNSVAQATNPFPLVGIFKVSSNSAPGTGNATVNFRYHFSSGVLLTNDNSVTVNVTYVQ